MAYVIFIFIYLIIQYNFVKYGARNCKSARERERERERERPKEVHLLNESEDDFIRRQCHIA